MPVCGSCEWFGTNGSLDWCYHVLKNYSTNRNNSACSLYRSKW